MRLWCVHTLWLFTLLSCMCAVHTFLIHSHPPCCTPFSSTHHMFVETPLSDQWHGYGAEIHPHGPRDRPSPNSHAYGHTLSSFGFVWDLLRKTHFQACLFSHFSRTPHTQVRDIKEWQGCVAAKGHAHCVRHYNPQQLIKVIYGCDAFYLHLPCV